jgi:signal transduction histidine kinase
VKILQESPRIAALDEQEQAFLKGIADNVDWATQFIQSLLDLTRIEAGAPLRLDRTSLNGFLHACADRFSFLAKDKGLALVFEALPQELQIEVDRMRMAQVIHNLLSNAIKYTPPGGQVILRAQPSDGGVYISVEDSGYGIPARYLPQIFDKFFRVPHSKHRQQEGTGLGLSIVKAIVEQHGGQVQVESQEGQGTCFTVFLPLS